MTEVRRCRKCHRKVWKMSLESGRMLWVDQDEHGTYYLCDGKGDGALHDPSFMPVLRSSIVVGDGKERG